MPDIRFDGNREVIQSGRDLLLLSCTISASVQSKEVSMSMESSSDMTYLTTRSILLNGEFRRVLAAET